MNKLNAENRNPCNRKQLQNQMRLAAPISIALVLVGCSVDDPLDSSSQALVAPCGPVRSTAAGLAVPVSQGTIELTYRCFI
jgi:hypothetical protein